MLQVKISVIDLNFDVHFGHLTLDWMKGMANEQPGRMDKFSGWAVPTRDNLHLVFFWQLNIILSMSNYRRTKINAAWYFFTILTYRRRSFLTDDFALPILKEAFRQIKTDRPFDMPVFCLLPNPLHCIWKMPEGKEVNGD